MCRSTWTTRSLHMSCKLHRGWRWDFKILFYCELQQSCHFYVTNLSFKHYITVKIQLTVSNFSFFIIIHNGFVFVAWNSSISVTIQNYTPCSYKLFFTMTETITSQDTDLTSPPPPKHMRTDRRTDRCMHTYHA